MPASDDRRRDDEPEFVDDVGSKQRSGDRDAPVDADIAARPGLQVPHEIDQLSVDHARVGSLAFERRRGCDVLGNGVDERGERLDLAAWPELCPLVVTAAAENDRVLGLDEIGAAGIRFVVPRVMNRSGASATPSRDKK
ncbi:hypothetical protein [Actinopolymorpha pittospori]